jgi:DnaJ homolog subfamily B member 12
LKSPKVNKEEAERCRDMGAAALRNGQYDRAVKLLKKSLSMYVLPGVEALLHQAEQRASSGTRSENNTSSDTPQRTTSSVNRSSSNATEGSDGRAYTEDQAKLVSEILRAKEGGRGAHYRVLGVSTNASDSDLKKAYRKRALQLHPDKNSAPHADEAFKAIGLAYATLSDPEKRNIYDRFGDEDPDNRGGGAAAARGPGGMHFRRAGAGEVDPEEIFNMFFGGMPMHGGNRGGVHFYTTGFGPGMRFGGAVPQRQPNAQQQPAPSLMAMFFNYLPFLIIMAMSFMNLQNNNGQAQNRYFSLTVSFHSGKLKSLQYLSLTKFDER